MHYDMAWLGWESVTRLIDILKPENIRFVGGAVRDTVLGRAIGDIDVATLLLPEQVMNRLKQAGIKVIPTGLKHGTVTVLIPPHSFEVTTLRRDEQTNGRHAIVSPVTDWEVDAMRRDFTFNALYCTPAGEIMDYWNGIEDAKQGMVRFIGDPDSRIQEDFLRILRFFRFYASYGGQWLDTAGLKACVRQAANIMLLSGERIRQEMLKLLVAEKRVETLQMMQKQGILQYIIPFAVEPLALQHLDFSYIQESSIKKPLIALALLLRSTKEANAIETLVKRWKLSNHDYQLLVRLASQEQPLLEADPVNWKKTIRKSGKTVFMARAVMAIAEGAEKELAARAIAFADDWHIPAFPVGGNDLLTLQIAQGKEVGKLLKKMEYYWEEKDYMPSKEELIQHFLP